MTALLHAHDADGAAYAPDGRHRTSVHVRGGVGAVRVDTEELRTIESRLEEVQRAASHLESALHRASRQLALDADLAPAAAQAAEETIGHALDGWWGVRRLADDVADLAVSLMYARMLYEEAERTAHTPAPTALAHLRLLAPGLAVGWAVLSIGGRLSRVGRVPGLEPGGWWQTGLVGLGEALNALHGDDDLPPDGIALDGAARALGEHGQLLWPWFLAPPSFTYDGRLFQRDRLSATQRLLVPSVAIFHAVTGHRRRPEPHVVLSVAPAREVPATPDLPAVVDSLHEIHKDHGATPGTVEIRRVDHPDGSRSWTVLLPSTQDLGFGGPNPVDNLTNVQTYGGMPSDVETGAAQAMLLAGIRPGEPVALVGFSQGGLVAMRLAGDPLLRRRFTMTAVVTAGSPVAHLPTPPDAEVLHLEHLEDPIVGLDGFSNPAEAERTTVSRSLASGTTGELRFAVPPAESHSITEYARTAELALDAREPSVVHVAERLAAVTGGPDARVTATAYTLERS